MKVYFNDKELTESQAGFMRVDPDVVHQLLRMQGNAFARDDLELVVKITARKGTGDDKSDDTPTPDPHTPLILADALDVPEPKETPKPAKKKKSHAKPKVEPKAEADVPQVTSTTNTAADHEFHTSVKPNPPAEHQNWPWEKKD